MTMNIYTTPYLCQQNTLIRRVTKLKKVGGSKRLVPSEVSNVNPSLASAPPYLPPQNGIMVAVTSWINPIFHHCPDILCFTAAPCNKPLGLQNRRLPNSRISASSEWNHFHAARLGRLGQVKHGRFVGAWCARHNNHLQWFKCDFGRPMKITQVATQGRQDTNQWVTSFYLSSSQDNVHWEVYKFRSAYKVTMIKTFVVFTKKFSIHGNRPRSIYQYFNMATGLSGQN